MQLSLPLKLKHLWSAPRDWTIWAAALLVLAYGAAAGFHTLADPDLPWQLRDARYLVETHSIARQDVFSYTAAGHPWIYPQGAGLVFYGLYRLGGYAALTWLSVMACAGTAAALLAVRPGLLSASAVFLAIPLIAWRTAVRAELFTTFLFTLFLALLARGTAVRRIWLLPVLMALWVNFHPGFVLGLGLIALFVLAALLARAPARPLVLAGGLALLATLFNPFGWSVWKVLWQQGRVTAVHRSIILEWWPSPFTWTRLLNSLEWRDPDSAYFLLLALGVLLLPVAFWRKKWTAGLLVAAFAAVSLFALRFQAMYAITVCVLVAELSGELQRIRVRQVLRWAAVVALAAAASLRVVDLATNEYYFARPDNAVFGAGLSYIFPERAAGFIARERLPGRIFHEYALGGYLSWKLGRSYPIFIDGRAVPFGSDLLLEHTGAMRMEAGSLALRAFLDRWGVQTIVMSLDRHSDYPWGFRQTCDSSDFRLVYLDEVAAVFLRNSGTARPWIERLARRCDEFVEKPEQRAAGEPPYIFYAQTAKLYQQLGRSLQAWLAITEARRYFDRDPDLDVLAGQIQLSSGRIEQARAEFLRATRTAEPSRAWYALGVLEGDQARHQEAIRAFERGAQTSALPQQMYLPIGEQYLALQEPDRALRWFVRARQGGRSLALAEALGPRFFAASYAGEARARFLLGDTTGSENAWRLAFQADPQNPYLRLMQAEFYLGQGRPQEARAALGNAKQLGAAGPVVEQLQKKLEK